MELRYALRSIEKYLTGYRNIYIIGHQRKWLTGVNYLPAEDNYTRKQFSIFQKILHAVKCDEISDPFLMWNDDHFLLKPIDVKDIKHWRYSTLQTLMARSAGTYQRTVTRTYNYCKAKGWGISNFDIHVPIPYEKQKFASLGQENWDQCHVIKSLYCNKHGIEGEEMKDLVIGKPLKRDEILNAITGRTFFSINEQGTNEQVRNILKELYPEKSKHEV